MLKRLSEKQMKSVCAFCCLAYFVSYLIRLNYAACMVEIQQALQVDKSVVGLPVMLCFFSYGAGQLIFGYLGDRVSPQWLIFSGLMGSSVCNFIVALFPGMGIIIPVWCLNGIFQSMLWPPMVRIMAELLSEKWYRYCCVLVTIASASATMAIYLLAPVCIRFSGWQAAFVLPGIAGVLMAVFWIGGMGRYGTGSRTLAGEPEADTKKETAFRLGSLLADVPLVPILCSIILQGVLRDGITTWMPVYMSEVFGMSNASSILSAAVLPVFGVVATLSATLLLNRLKNEVLTAALLFGFSALPGIVMLAFYDRLPGMCIVMMMLMTGCMHGINLMLISRLPEHFARFGKVSSISGILNAAVYVGSSISSYGFGALAEWGGWKGVIVLWVIMGFAGAALLLAARRRWERFCH